MTRLDSIPPQQTKDKHAEDVSPGPQQSQTVSLSSPTFDKVEQAAPQDTASPERQFKSPPKSQINKDLHIPIQRANSLPHPLPLRGARGKSGLADMVPRASSLTAISSSRTMTDEAAIELIPKEQLRELFKPVFLKQIAQQNSSINANEALKFITDEDILGLAKLMPPVMAQVRASEIEAGEPDAQQQSEPTDQLQAEPLEPEDHDGEAMADVSLPELASSVNDDDKSMTDERAPSPDVAMVDVMPSPPRKPAEPPLTTDTGDAEPANDKASESPDIPLIELVSSRRAIPPSQQSAVPSAPPMPAIVALDAQKPLLELTHTSHMDVDEVLAADSGLLEPIVCCAFQGTLHPTTSHHQFTISKQAAFQAKQWCDRFDSYRSSNSFTRFQVRLFSDVSATEDSNTLNRTPLPILIRINNDHLQVYGEHEFSSNNQSFCINPFIVPGTNNLEVIQTGSMEGWTIFVEQVRPSEPELKELSQHHSKTNDWFNFLRKIGNCQLLPQPTFADVDS
ncbi:hypothetical protein FRC03_003976 [Tulasnella sp. 419]|nr:hypothetical protein FRC03_003976 [Tulasnella sp. 419]